MARVERSVLVEHSAAEMFRLVDDVEAYPEFLPWCNKTVVRSRTEQVTEAAIHIDYHHLRQHFATRNFKTFPTRMDIQLQEGPFKRLQGHWHFIPLTERACKIEFVLEYEFSGRILEKLIGPVFGYIAGSLVEAFVRRAAAQRANK